MTPIRIEAEDMTLTTYRTELGSFASGGNFISLVNAAGRMGNAETVFTGEEGSYDVVIGYYDENDGVSQLQVSLGGVPLQRWNLDQNLGYGGASTQTLMRRTLATGVSLNQGTAIKIQGAANQTEYARVDYIEFIPVGASSTINGTNAAETLTGNALNNIINGGRGADTLIGGAGNDTLIGGTGNDILNGGAGIDTASYAQASSGIIANLNTGVVTRIAKIMPLGDSITHGIVNSNLDGTGENLGGYRTELWNSFKADSLTVDFVGSMSTGPNSLGDKDHEGHPGKTIDWIADRVNGWLNTSTPDIVLLMIGTNDTRTSDSISQMSSELSCLIDKITQQLPDAQLLLSSIPPINPAGQSQALVQKALGFNAAIPHIVDNKVAEGKKVKFVDMTSLTVRDMSSPPNDNGLHPTVNGYGKIADFWYDALLDIGVEQGTFSVDKDTLSNIENIVGTAFNDKLVGNAGVNIIEGGAGNDTLDGGAGIDTLIGGNGNDVLVGGEGNDMLTGGAGNDRFTFNAFNQGIDTIVDFGTVDDIYVSAAGFGGGLVANNAAIAASGFLSGSGVMAATNSNQRFIYNTDNGALLFDADGNGTGSAAMQIATLTNASAFANTDIFVIG